MLRSVSPVHLEYLANMGVVSSMSVSLIDRGKLWGLIACHHYAGPHRPSYTDRTAAEFLGRTASLLLHTKVAAGEAEGVLEVAQRSAELTAAVGRTPRALGAALTEEDVTVLDLVPAAGAARPAPGGRPHPRSRPPSPPPSHRQAPPSGSTDSPTSRGGRRPPSACRRWWAASSPRGSLPRTPSAPCCPMPPTSPTPPAG